MIRVKIDREIHIRKGPGQSFDSLGSIKPGGKMIEMVDWVEGESLKSNNKWFFNINRKNEKQYYWAGGITVVDGFEALAPPNSPTTTVVSGPQPATGSLQSKISDFLTHGDFNLHRGSPSFRDWKVSWGHVDLEIWKMWNHPRLPTRGENLNIAVIDNGAPSGNPNLQVNDVDCFYSLHDGASVIDTSANMHGCMCAGVVSSTGPQVLGIAPASKLFIARTFQKDGTFSYEALRDSIRWAILKECDIISLSFAANQVADEKKIVADEIRHELQQCKDKNILVVCAIGNSGAVGIPQDNVFPACEPQCIAIGGYEQGALKRFQTTTPSTGLKYLLPASSILTTTLNGADFIGRDSSIATPIMAGVLGLFISLIKSGKVNLKREELLQQLIATGIKVSERIGNTDFHYTIPQPSKLLDKL